MRASTGATGKLFATNMTIASMNATTMAMYAPAATVTAKSVNAPFFTLLMKEWKEVPELGPFTDACVGLVEKLLPRLRMEYTKLQVPKVLLHDCDVYATKTDYQVNKTDMDTARGTCRLSARELGDTYMSGEKNYKGWCTNLHVYLTDQANFHMSQADRDKLLSEAEQMRRELEELRRQYEEMMKAKGKSVSIPCSSGKDDCKGGLPCCPKTCKPCY